MFLNKTHCCFTFFFLFTISSQAQLKAYNGKGTDDNCKTIYLVNPSVDTIYYIAGLMQKDLNECRSFSENKVASEKYFINLSRNEDAYLLLLPKDTISYKILISAESYKMEKQLLILAKTSEKVIDTNDDKKRNKKIKKLPGGWMTVPVTE